MAQTSGIFISNSSSYLDVPIPTGRNLAYFLNVNDNNALYAMRSDRSVFPIFTKGPVWLFGGTFDYTQWQPNAGTVGSISMSITLPPYTLLTGLTMKVNSYFQVGFPTFKLTDDINSSGIGNPIALAQALSNGRTATKFVAGDYSYIIENSRPLIGVMTTIGAIDNMDSGNFDLWYKIETVPSIT